MVYNGVLVVKKYDFPPEFSIPESQLIEKKEATILGVIVQ